MTDVNRRGFLKLLGIAGAIATIPSSVIDILEAPEERAQEFTFTHGLYVRNSKKLIRRLGSVNALGITRPPPVRMFSLFTGDEVKGRDYRPSTLDFSTLSTIEEYNATRAVMDEALHNSFEGTPYQELLVIMRYRPDITNKSVPSQPDTRLMVAVPKVFIKDIGDIYVTSSDTPAHDVKTSFEIVDGARNMESTVLLPDQKLIEHTRSPLLLGFSEVIA